MSQSRTTLQGSAGTVEIDRDEHGVAHVAAGTIDDALHGLGFCHARDRGLQMLLVRILGRGQACQWLKASDEMLTFDRFFRRLNFGGDAASEWTALSPRARAAVNAYCAGANIYFERSGIPWELSTLGYRTEGDPWAFADIYLVAKVIGYVSLAVSQFQIERFLLECVQHGVARELLEELFPGQLDGLDEHLVRQVRIQDRIVPEHIWHLAGLMPAVASNNWVVAGSKTATGTPICCSDPHLQINRLPAVWYEVGLRWTAGGQRRYALGASVPGTPGIVIGRNNDLSWGVTYGFADCVDSWVEECRAGQYRRADGWHSFRVREETIHGKGMPPVLLRFYENEHGTLEGDPHEPGYYLATRWSCGEETGAASVEGLLGILEAQSVEQGRVQLAKLSNSSWNWGLADRAGAIGYQMSGKIPLRGPSASGLVPLPGWDPANDWQGFARFEELPRDLNPPDGLIVTANDDLSSLGTVRVINLTLAPYRALRIRSVLAQSGRLTLEDMKRLQLDLYSTQAERFKAILRPILSEWGSHENARLLADWDLTYRDDSTAAFLFERFYRALIDEVFGSGADVATTGLNGGSHRLGIQVVIHVIEETDLMTVYYGAFDRILLAERSAWFGSRTRGEIYKAALARALEAEVKPYGEGRRIVLRHLLLGGRLPQWLGFDRGPILLKGGRATVHQGQIFRDQGRLTAAGPSYRFVTDLATDELQTALPGGPSDRRFSRWYASGLEDWSNGEYKTLTALPEAPE